MPKKNLKKDLHSAFDKETLRELKSLCEYQENAFTAKTKKRTNEWLTMSAVCINRIVEDVTNQLTRKIDKQNT